MTRWSYRSKPKSDRACQFRREHGTNDVRYAPRPVIGLAPDSRHSRASLEPGKRCTAYFRVSVSGLPPKIPVIVLPSGESLPVKVAPATTIE